MKIYEIKNCQYETKQAIGGTMAEALYRYARYLHDTLSADYSPDEIVRNITSCTYVGEYQEPDYIK